MAMLRRYQMRSPIALLMLLLLEVTPLRAQLLMMIVLLLAPLVLHSAHILRAHWAGCGRIGVSIFGTSTSPIWCCTGRRMERCWPSMSSDSIAATTGLLLMAAGAHLPVMLSPAQVMVVGRTGEIIRAGIVRRGPS